jgi:ABC-2 family transporter protein
MSALGQAWFVARKDLAVLIRQRETILWVFVMPVVFFYFIGTVTGGFGGGGARGPVALALEAPEQSGFLAGELAHRLEREGFQVERGPGAEAARRLVVPAPPAGRASFTAAVLAGDPVALAFRSTAEGPGGDLDRVRLGRAVYGMLADLAVASARGVEPDAALFRELEAAPRPMRLDVRPAGRRRHIPTGFEQTIPGTMVMFTMLVLLTSGAVLLVIEREQGLLRRLAAAPIPRAAVVGGKWIGRMALGLVQIAFAALAGTLLFGMDWGAAPLAVAAVLVAWAAFNASLGIVLANVARSTKQMTGIGVLASMALAALGGCWWPIEIAPRAMQRFALFLPTGWAMDAMHRLVSFGYGGGAVLPHVAALAAGALVLGALGSRTFRYE